MPPPLLDSYRAESVHSSISLDHRHHTPGLGLFEPLRPVQLLTSMNAASSSFGGPLMSTSSIASDFRADIVGLQRLADNMHDLDNIQERLRSRLARAASKSPIRRTSSPVLPRPNSESPLRRIREHSSRLTPDGIAFPFLCCIYVMSPHAWCIIPCGFST